MQHAAEAGAQRRVGTPVTDTFRDKPTVVGSCSGVEWSGVEWILRYRQDVTRPGLSSRPEVLVTPGRRHDRMLLWPSSRRRWTWQHRWVQSRPAGVSSHGEVADVGHSPAVRPSAWAARQADRAWHGPAQRRVQPVGHAAGRRALSGPREDRRAWARAGRRPAGGAPAVPRGAGLGYRSLAGNALAVQETPPGRGRGRAAGAGARQRRLAGRDSAHRCRRRQSCPVFLAPARRRTAGDTPLSAARRAARARLPAEAEHAADGPEALPAPGASALRI